MPFRLPLYFLLIAVSARSAGGWWGDGHETITRAAIRALPEDAPEFLKEGEELVASTVYDPDLARNRSLANLRDREHPEHFLDIELLDGRPLPGTRYEFARLCREVGVSPSKVGFLPYAVAEWTEQLTLALAEHRRWPGLEAPKSKALVYAGLLAHYAQDLFQPLHLTIHFDGLAPTKGNSSGDGSKLHSGIHEKVDSLIDRLAPDPDALAADCRPQPFDDLMAAVRSRFAENHAKVGRVYELADGFEPLSGPAARFGRQQAVAAAQFTASLYLTAWRVSEEVRLPGWLDRPEPVDGLGGR